MYSEMNAHIPQSYEATAELQEIAAVPMQIIRPRDGTPLIGVVQDALVGAYLATQPGNLFTRREFMNLMMKNKRFQGLTAPRDTETNRYTGQQIVGSLFAPINVNMKNSSYETDEQDLNIVKIVEGEFLQGVLDKGIFNKSGKGIIHTTYNDYGQEDTVALLDGLQNVLEAYLIMKGFSVGISDLIADENTRKEMEVVIADKKKQVDQMLLQLHMDLFTNNSGKSNQEEVEGRAFAILNKAIEEAGKIGLTGLSSSNRLMAMIRCGSKGDANNVSQMIACVGQTALEGKRIPYGFTDRTLPHYKMYDDSAEARGFVQGSFVRGLTPQEMFFHAMSGREGLIDTAVKTAETGYTQRQLIKAMEELTTQHDGTVRDATGNILQFHYGEDGINSTKIEEISIPLNGKSEETIRTTFGLVGVDLSQVLQEGTDRGDDTEALQEYVEEVLKDRKMIVEGVYQSGHSRKLFVPLNLERILLNIKIKFSLNPQGRTTMTPKMVLEGIQRVAERTQPFNKVWIAALRYHLAPHTVLVENRMTKDAWDTMIETIVIKNWKSWAVPGELVGIVAAQSIGEPATQMSNLSSTVIVVNDSKNMSYKGPIGPYIDKLLESKKDSVVEIGHNSVVLDLVDDLSILGVSNDEKTSWRRISQVSRHPANGGMVEIRTRTGRKTTATLTHSFLKRSPEGIVPVLGSELKVGMRVPVATYIQQVPNPIRFVKSGGSTFVLDKKFGWLCGIYLADGSMNGNSVRITKIAPIVEVKLREFCTEYKYEFSVKHYQGAYGPGKDNFVKSKDLKDFLLENFGEGSYDKFIGATAFHAPLEFIQGLVAGYFDGDGNVVQERNHITIRVGSRSEPLIRDINRLLGYCNMFGVFGQETSIRIPDKVLYTLNIPRKFAHRYQETIGFALPEKAEALQGIIDYIEREDVHSHQEMIDKIPELGPVIAQTGKLLRMPGQSRTFGRWTKKESIGRRTLEEYIKQFKEMMTVYVDPVVIDQVIVNIAILESALNADVLWDEIVELVYHDDPKEYVYDFTVPGNDSFMVDDNILVHNTLNTFHQAGVASKSAMTRGVPRLKELLKVTHNPKATSLTITLIPEFRNVKERVREVTQDLELTLLRDIVLKAAIYYDPVDATTVIEEDKNIIKFHNIFEQSQMSSGEAKKGDEEVKMSQWLIRLEFDREKMFNKNITMDDVNFVISDIHGSADQRVDTVYSDYNSSRLIMRIRVQLGESMYGDDLASIKKFQNKMLNNTIIRGVPGIRSVTWRKDKALMEQMNGKYAPVEQYLLDTDGSNFLAVMNHPAVDGNRLYSTNVHDIYEQLGIEATRFILYAEIASLFGEADINYRHLGLLVDVMTRNGRLMSVDRYGINKNDSGPLAKACFEETEKILLKAALFGEMDPVTGVSANIMTGQPVRAGTAFSQILLDEAALPRLMEGLSALPEDDVEDDAPDQDQINSEIYEDKNDACAQTQLQMNLTLPTATSNIQDEEDIEINVI